MKQHVRHLILVMGALLIAGCSFKAPQKEGIKISSIRPAPEGIETRHRAIRKSDYSQALESSRGAANLRVIPMVVSATQAPPSPEYRLFNVRPGSVGEILGLIDADVLVAAHDYIIQDPSQFFVYLSAVRAEKNSQIEIRRKGKPILLTFEFVE